MPRISIYITAADKTLLDELPDEMTGAVLVRRALTHFRGGHVCPATGRPEADHTRCVSDADTDPVHVG